MTTADGVRRRGRSVQKRLAILDAARELFIRDGYELTSVDAIAARAEVSKRTVYDHFGDKERIHTAVLERVNERLTATIQAALDEELTAGCDLRAGLLAFVRRVATEAFPSSDYADYRHLTTRYAPGRRNPRSIANAPRELFVRRMEAFADEGAIRTERPRRAAQHFVALTFQLALDTLDPTETGAWDAVDEILVDGVDVFIRSYT
ncbi:TetR/AcrR family transcriptional regulator [Mycolicibacterium vanbaalenii]|jgi:TetR/AcrR family transcriptional repressor of mexJK operon|uniref:TetR/AcrR family transcriptional regulator n=1 Tax=Mycolicibacterium vanbaalenii TaxID=110539 RepID=UPI001F448300|nr:TetR/AcrR family transcriptional regulator [Mycolicibacterium vanbaalenii]UJL29325.1 TetR/AcrR family transcriptional regulator [Mycolicibacterium vanbaalenii]WND57648.1 helix-turn-helix domain-containing protein [Mycolicibacterium vanbaalenii]